MLNVIQQKLGALVPLTWAEDTQTWGERIKLYRDYNDGNHRAKLTPEMKAMLRISGDETDQFNDNYCELVVSTMADRLTVERIEAITPHPPAPSPTRGEGENGASPNGQQSPPPNPLAASQGGGTVKDVAQVWVDDVLESNRFDGFQMDVHEACIRDGDTFVMVSYDNEKQMVKLHHEPAYDGDVGMIAVYDRMRKDIVAAVKIWVEAGLVNPSPPAIQPPSVPPSMGGGIQQGGVQNGGSGNDVKRVNIYYPDRVEKYISGLTDGGVTELRPFVDSETDDTGKVDWLAKRVPVIHFRNRARANRTTGISELASVVPLQDALNRTLVSMVMTSELSAFQIRIALGFDPPSNVTPGMWVIIGKQGMTKDQVADAKTLEQAQLVPFINQANFIIQQIGTISRTPLPDSMGGDTSSGEALKQREVHLLGKVQKFQVKGGNAWEDVIDLGWTIQATFGRAKPPAVKRWSTKWQDAQIRNDTDVIDNALKVRDVVGEKEFLRLIAPVYGYDEAKIEAIIEEKAGEAALRLSALSGSLPGFGQFATPPLASQPPSIPPNMGGGKGETALAEAG